MIVGLTPSISAAQEPAIVIPYGFITGNTYREKWSDDPDRVLYITGLFDGLMMSSMFGGDGSLIMSFKACLNGMNNKQVTVIVDKYLAAHPELWHQDMQVLAVDAIKEICPSYREADAAYWNEQAAKASAAGTRRR